MHTCRRAGTRSSCSSRADVKGWALVCAVAVGVYSCVEVITRSRLMTSQSSRYVAALQATRLFVTNPLLSCQVRLDMSQCWQMVE